MPYDRAGVPQPAKPSQTRQTASPPATHTCHSCLSRSRGSRYDARPCARFGLRSDSTATPSSPRGGRRVLFAPRCHVAVEATLASNVHREDGFWRRSPILHIAAMTISFVVTLGTLCPQSRWQTLWLSLQFLSVFRFLVRSGSSAESRACGPKPMRRFCG